MLESWLQPGGTEFSEDVRLTDYHFGKKVIPFDGEMPDLKPVKIALIGVEKEVADPVRRELYNLAYPFDHLKIADLGNVRKPDANFIAPLIQELLDGQVLPILFGRTEALILSQFFAHKAIQSSVNLAIADERIRYESQATAASAPILTPIVSHESADLFHLSLIGFQTHFISPAVLNLFESRHFDLVRLGKARADLATVEPLIRDADFFAFHLAALRQSEAPGQETPTPNGFFGEEACQLCRYAGMSDKLRSFSICGFAAEADRERQTAQLAAQMIWYFIEGFHQRKGDFPASTDGMVEYVVHYKEYEDHLTFWKSSRSGRWWVQVPVKTKKKQQRHRLVPCNYADYQQACQGELPQRLVDAFKRFS